MAGSYERENLSDWFTKLEQRAYKTYLARVHSWRRLNARNHAWNAFLIALAGSTTIAAVAMLVDPLMFGLRGDVLTVIVAIFSLVASLVVPVQNYSARSRDMFSNYRRIQRLSYEVERARDLGVAPDSDEAREMLERYQSLLDESENHAQSDFAKALRAQFVMSPPPSQAGADDIAKTEAEAPVTAKPTIIPRTAAEVWENVVSLLPYLALVVPLLLLGRVVLWLFGH